MARTDGQGSAGSEELTKKKVTPHATADGKGASYVLHVTESRQRAPLSATELAEVRADLTRLGHSEMGLDGGNRPDSRQTSDED